MNFTTTEKDANNFTMKAFWYKICRIFGIKSKNMTSKSKIAQKAELQEPRKGFFVKALEWVLDKVSENDTAPVMISERAKTMLADEDLSRQFSEHMIKGDSVFTLKKGDKKYTVNVMK